MKCLAVDVGSSSIKGAVLDVAASRVSEITTRPFPDRLPGLPPRYFEVDPRAMERATRDVLKTLVALAPDAERLYVAGQMGGLLLVDHSGEPLSNYYSWRDLRSTDEEQAPGFLQQIRERLGEDLFHTLGRELQAGSTLTLLRWLKLRGELSPGATPVTAADYVIGRLCGAAGQMHVTHAIGLLDLRTIDWHREAFAALDLDDLSWPKLVRGIEPVGECRIGDRALTVHGAFGDQQCALFGAGLARGELSINMSTGSQVSRRIDRLVSSDAQTRAYFEGDLLQTITHLPAGRSLNVLVQLLTELARAEQVELRNPWGAIARLSEAADEAASRVASAEGATDELAVDLSFFAGPFGSTGSVTGITTENLSVGTLFRAAFASMAENYALSAARLDPAKSWERIVLSGSMSRSLPLLRRMIQQQFTAPLRDATSDEETLLGMLKMAGERSAG